MDLKSIINKIKLAITEEVEVKMTDVKTQDGLILSYDGELAVGIEIFLVDEMGKNPAPDAEYILEDGTKIVVVAGLVEELEAPEEVVEEAPVEEVPVAEVPVEAEVATLSLEDLQSEITALKEENLQIREILEQLAETFSQKTFEKEVKMSQIQPENAKVELSKQKNTKKHELNNIFKNMYK